MFICDNLSIGPNGHLFFAGQDTVALAKQYGTPLYLLDEERVRRNCRTYKEAMRRVFGERALPLYASKANSFRQIYRIMQEEAMGTDVVSPGEIVTAKSAGFPMENAFFHGNNKTPEDVALAMDNQVGYFVVDNEEEVFRIEQEAQKRGICQKVLIRITPGIDTHTYEAVNTGKVDSKFGNAILTGQAEKITLLALSQKHLSVVGFHCHVGSQVFAEDVFERAATIMIEFMADMKKKHNYTAEALDLGGGYGVRYVEEDPVLDIPTKLAEVGKAIQTACQKNDFPVPFVYLEPGRSIVADAGMTLYTVGSCKTIPGYKRYVSIDGGMADNPRYALYRSKYTCLLANKISSEAPRQKCSVVGRCCESGDIIQENVPLPEDVEAGDILAVCTTGAYNYAMSSHYNRLPNPPTVLLKDGTSYVAVRRETLEDLYRLDN